MTDDPVETDLEFLDDLPTADVTAEEGSGLPETITVESKPETKPDPASQAELDEALETPPERLVVTRKKSASKAAPAKKKTSKGAQTTQTTKERPAKQQGASKPATADTPKKTSKPSEAAPAAQTGPEQGTADKEPELPAPRESRPVQPPAPAQAPELTLPVTKSNDHQQLPPDGIPRPRQGDLVEPHEPVLLGNNPLSKEMMHRWDEMMTTLSGNTRNAIWETGIQDMQELLRTARPDLVKPRGQLAEAQCQELEAWLGRNGYLIPKKAEISPRGRKNYGRPSSKAVDVKTGAEVDNRAVREARIRRMKAMRTGG